MTQKELAKAAKKIVKSTFKEEIADLSVAGIAEQLGVSAPNLSRAFKKLYKQSLIKFIRQWKNENFLMMLDDEDDKPLDEILEIMDIRSPSNFIQNFKRWIGFTPGHVLRIRRRLKKKKPKKG
jgi:AraC-like DNA-binding protein